MSDWQAGTPTQPGWYIVALTYQNGMATIGCATWDGDIGWSTAQGDHVVAYIPVKDVLNQANITWPEHLTGA